MVRVLFFFALSSLSASTNASTSAPPPGRMCPLQTKWTPEHLEEGGSIVFPVSLGSTPASLIVDTGASSTTIDLNLAKRAGLKFEDEKVRRGPNGDIPVSNLGPTDLVVAGASLHLQSAEAADLTNVNFGPEKFGIILGRDVLSRCAIEINSDKNLARVGDRSLDLTKAIRVTISYLGSEGFPALPVKLGPNLITIAGIDTGSQEALVLGDQTWSQIDKRGIRETSVVTGGLTGFVVEKLAFLPTVSIGSARLANIETRVSASPPSGVVMGLIGLGVLSRFNSVIDLGSGTVWLVPRRTAAPTPPKSTSGVLAIAQGDQLQIAHIMRNSPAAAAGLTEQDEICRIDGKAIPHDYATQPISSWSKGKPGRIVNLTLCDGRTRQLTLEQFY